MSDQNQNKGIGEAGPLDGSEAPNSLGASASLPVEPKRSRRRGGSSDAAGTTGRRRGTGRTPVWTAGVIVLAATLFALVPMVSSSLKKTPRDKVGISYGGGPFEGSHFQKIVQPGSGLFFNGFFDRLYLYPADQQNYIVSKTVSEGSKPRADAVVAPSKDRVQVSYQVAVYYKLNTDKLRAFHEEFGLKYQAYTADGWTRLIEDTFRQQIENALQEETRRHAVADIYGDAELLLQIQNSVQDTLSKRLQLAMGSRFFCAPTFRPGGTCEDPTFVIKKVEIPKAVVTAFENVRTSQIGIEAKENEVKQRQAEAIGIKALEEAFGESGLTYALLKAVESGQVPIWVVPSGEGLTLPTGGTAAGTPASPAAAGN